MQVVAKALEVRALRDENRQLKAELGRRYEFDNIIGRSPAMQRSSTPSSVWRPRAPRCCWPAKAARART